MADVSKGKHRPSASRVAVITLHTSPRDQPGTGDSGGMNVYILSVAQRLVEQGIAVDIYTRRRGRAAPAVEEIAPGSRLIQVPAGPCAPVAKEDLPTVVPAFLGNVLERVAKERGEHRHSPYDVVHSHYWLSGWVGRHAKQIWGVPLVASFHTLAKVKNEALAAGERPEPSRRVKGEHDVVRGADRILAPTPAEASDLVRLYRADPRRINVVPPGVDPQIFFPGPKRAAQARVGLENRRVLLFAGRLQPVKGADIAIRALAGAISWRPEVMADVVLAVVGGPSGTGGNGEVRVLKELASSLGVAGRVVFFPAQPQATLAAFYRAADAVLMPSRSESFGLVALEAQACGTPVVAAATGGLRYAIAAGKTGFLVHAGDPTDYAQRVLTVLEDPSFAKRLSRAAVAHARSFSWEATAGEIRQVYEEIGPRRAA